MPVYEYECKECEKVFEVQQRIADEPLKQCPDCDGVVKKLMSMSSFQLKGGGWYADGYSSTSGKAEAKSEKPAVAPCASSSSACTGCPAAPASS
jgi:putative FmdB family regulatory protein